MKKNVSLLTGFLFIVLIMTGCGSGEGKDPETSAIEAAEKWLELLDKGEYSRSWDEAAGFFKSVITQENWTATIQPLRAPLGKVLSRKVVARQYTTAIPNAPEGKYVAIQFSTSFENRDSATEVVTPMLDKDNQWRVSGYYIK